LSIKQRANFYSQGIFFLKGCFEKQYTPTGVTIMLFKKCLPLRGRKIPSKKLPSNYIKNIHLVLFVLLIHILKNIDRPANFKPK